MSTYPANLFPAKSVLAGEGSSSEDANTAQWHKVESKNTKRLRKQQARWNELSKEVTSDSNQPQQIKVKWFSCALSSLNTFAEAQVAAVKWKNKTRPRVMATLDGIKVDLLYDTGAMSLCLSKDTYNKCFQHKPINTT